MMLGARTAAWAKSGGGVPTARDYVQDGLIAMWDGIENAGWGLHSNAEPVDLINGVKLIAIGSPVITDTTFDTPKGAYYYADITDFRDAVAAKRFTFESVMSCVRVANNGIFSIGNRGIWIYGNINYNVSTVNVNAVNYTQAINPNYLDDGVFRISIVGDNTAPKVIIGTTEYSGYYGTLTSFPETRCYIGGMYDTVVFSSALKSFHNIRLYSRALTADEIAANYAIDKARFNLP